MATTEERKRHKLFLDCERALGTESAEMLMSSLPPVDWSDLATKEDLAHLESTLVARFDGRIDGLHGEIGNLGGEVNGVRGEIGNLGGEVNGLRGEIDALRGETQGRFDATDAKIEAIDTKIDTKLEAIDTKIDTKLEAIDTKFEAFGMKVDGQRDAIEGTLHRELRTYTVALFFGFVTVQLGFAGLILSLT